LHQGIRTGGFCKSQKNGKASRPKKVFPGRERGFSIGQRGVDSTFPVPLRIGKAANPHMAGEVEKIREALGKKKIDLKKLFDGGVKEETIGQVAAESGLDETILSFFLHSSIRPSIEAGVEQVCEQLDPETWRKGHCPVCGSLPP